MYNLSLYQLQTSIESLTKDAPGGYSPGVGASAVPAGGAIHFALGSFGHQSPGTMTGAGVFPWLDRRRRVMPVQTASQETWPGLSLRDDDSLGENRGGTPTGERALQSASRVERCGDTDQRLSGSASLFIEVASGE